MKWWKKLCRFLRWVSAPDVKTKTIREDSHRVRMSAERLAELRKAFARGERIQLSERDIIVID
jgi:hypothetical protein